MFGIMEFDSETHKALAIPHSLEPAVAGEPFKTVIIGDNASGKTRFIVSMIETFRLLHQLQTGVGTRRKNSLVKSLVSSTGAMNLQYAVNSERISFHVGVNGAMRVTRNGIPILPKNIPLPSRIIAVSTTYNDKFPFSSNDSSESDGEFYKYCGIRETTNASWSATLSRRIMENLLNIDPVSSYVPLKALFDQLSLRLRFRIKFEMAKKSFTSVVRSPEAFYGFVKKYSENSKRMQVGLFERFDIPTAESMLRGAQYFESDGRNLYFDVDLEDDVKDRQAIHEFLEIVRRVGLIKNLQLEFFRTNTGIAHPFSTASSGETQMLYVFSSLLRHASRGAIVFIDEPELSLHPAWQVRYVSLLKKALAQIKDCHLIIATHSHFILSDLDPANSSLHVFRSSFEGAIEIENVDYSTYAWSPENILYTAFGVRTVGNPAFENDLQEALNIIAHKKGDFARLEVLSNKFTDLIFDSADPLNRVVRSIKDYVDGNNQVVS